jgi:asparagine synthase (glutamine-hydrolysing)
MRSKYEEYGADFVDMLDGMYAFCLYDAKKDMVLVARDHVGICTLYLGFSTSSNTLFVASELKAMHDEANHIISFPPGHYLYATVAPEPSLSLLSLNNDKESINPSLKRYFQPKWLDPSYFPTPESTGCIDGPDYALIRNTLHKAVKSRLMCEVPFGVLLSGGLDSSLIAAITVRELGEIQKNASKDKVGSTESTDEDPVGAHGSNWWPKLHSFSIGLPNAPDLEAAKKAADYLGTIHHSFTFEFQEGIDAISDVIWHLESYDVTTIRASTPMFLLSRRIKSLGVKMVLSGEGSDEVYGG